MPRPKKTLILSSQNSVEETVIKTKKSKESKKTKVVGTAETETGFVFGGISLSKKEQRDIISNALNAKPYVGDIEEWNVEESEYTPETWVVIITVDGHIYQEPIPRYCDTAYFISLVAAMPDKVDKTATKFAFVADEICKTKFDVKNVDCYITSVAFNGTRNINYYSSIFEIKNTTRNVGGNLVFSGLDTGFDKAQCKKVVEAIVKRLNTYEESINVK